MNISSLPILSLVTFLPLAGAILVAVLPRTASRPVALGAALLTWVVSIMLLIGYLPGRPGFEFVEQASWIPLFGIDGVLLIASAVIAVIGILVAWRFFGLELFGLRARSRLEEVAAITNSSPITRFLYRASLNKWWFDDLNDLLFIRIGGRLAAAMWWFDREVVDGTVNGIGAVTGLTGRRLSRVQTGRVQNYALGIAIGLIVMAGSYLLIAAR